MPYGLKQLKFEIFGKVQGVYFRAFTEKKAKELSLVGWVRNTDHESVEGEAEGLPTNIAQFKLWLEKEGSPTCRIDHTNFKEVDILKPSYSEFECRR